MTDIDQLFITISNREESHGWDALSDAERTFVTVMLLWYEVGNGGFHQYFFNTTGDFALDAPAAFKDIGATQTANFVEQANALFGSDGPCRDMTKRQHQLKLFSESHVSKLDEFDEYIDEDPEDIEELLSVFAEQNILQG